MHETVVNDPVHKARCCAIARGTEGHRAGHGFTLYRTQNRVGSKATREDDRRAVAS